MLDIRDSPENISGGRFVRLSPFVRRADRFCQSSDGGGGGLYKKDLEIAQIILNTYHAYRGVIKLIYNDVELELVHNFKYLGLIININGSFKLAITELKNQTSMAMYALIGKCRKLCLPIDLQLELFDRMIVPIM